MSRLHGSSTLQHPRSTFISLKLLLSSSMTSMVIAPPPSRPRPPSDPPPRKLLLLGSLSPFEPLEPPDPLDPPDVSPTLHRFTFTSPKSCVSSAFHLVGALFLCVNLFVHESVIMLGFLTSFAVANCEKWCRCRSHVLWLLVLTCSPPPSLMTALTSNLFQRPALYLLRFALHVTTYGQI